MPDILVERDGPIGRLVLNVPEKGNALPFASLDLLVESLHDLEDDDDIKIIILKGNGKSFCTGHDFDDAVKGYGLNQTDEAGKHIRANQRTRLAVDRRLGDSYMAFQYSAKPVIAQVHGACLGAGIYLVELVDLAICADNTRFSHAEQRMAFAGNTWLLNTQILLYGVKKAREILLFGSEFDGKEAEHLGLVNRSVPETELESTVEAWAQQLSRNSKDALVMGKAMHRMALDSLGGSQQFFRGTVGHSLATNIKYDADEFSFFRARRDKGTRGAVEDRQAHYDAPDPTIG